MHYNLPCGALLQISMAAVGHSEVHGVRPQGWIVQSSGNGRVVKEGLFFHHGELVVSTHTKVRGTDTYYTVIGKIGVLLGDNPHASHLLSPVIDGCFRPEPLVIIVPVSKAETGLSLPCPMIDNCMNGTHEYFVTNAL